MQNYQLPKFRPVPEPLQLPVRQIYETGWSIAPIGGHLGIPFYPIPQVNYLRNKFRLDIPNTKTNKKVPLCLNCQLWCGSNGAWLGWVAKKSNSKEPEISNSNSLPLHFYNLNVDEKKNNYIFFNTKYNILLSNVYCCSSNMCTVLNLTNVHSIVNYTFFILWKVESFFWKLKHGSSSDKMYYNDLLNTIFLPEVNHPY